MCSAHQKIFAITYTFDITQFDNMLQKFFNCSFCGSTSLLSVIIKPSSYRASIYLLKINSRSTRTRCEKCSKLTIKTPEQPQLSWLRCLYCKLYTHFATCLVFVLLTLNIQLFAGQLSSFCEETHRQAAMWNSSEK